ncbi:MAG: hypothetical protein DRO00_05055, partial [Thermoproteota archaeon]
ISKPIGKYSRRISHVLAAKKLGSALEKVRYVVSDILSCRLWTYCYSADKYASWLGRAAEPSRQMLGVISSQNSRMSL